MEEKKKKEKKKNAEINRKRNCSGTKTGGKKDRVTLLLLFLLNTSLGDYPCSSPGCMCVRRKGEVGLVERTERASDEGEEGE